MEAYTLMCYVTLILKCSGLGVIFPAISYTSLSVANMLMALNVFSCRTVVLCHNNKGNVLCVTVK